MVQQGDVLAGGEVERGVGGGGDPAGRLAAFEVDAGVRGGVALEDGDDLGSVEPSSTRHSSQSVNVWPRTEAIASSSMCGGGSWTGVSTEINGASRGARRSWTGSRVARRQTRHFWRVTDR